MSTRWIGVAGLGEAVVAIACSVALASLSGLPSQAAVVLAFLPAIAFGIHVCEEFTIPGGYSAWAAIYRPERAAEQTRLHLWRVNVIGGAAAFLVAFAAFDYVGGYAWLGVRAWLAVVFTLAENAGYHIGGTVATHRYSPGLVTSIVLYLPLTVVSVVELLAVGAVDPISVVGCAFVGIVLFRLIISQSRHHAGGAAASGGGVVG